MNLMITFMIFLISLFVIPEGSEVTLTNNKIKDIWK